MKLIYSLLAVFLMLPFAARSQSATPKHVQWQFSVKKLDNDLFRLEAKATVDAGFHIFAQDPGGDGTLIPTSFTTEGLQSGGWAGDWKESAAPKTERVKELDETIRYHEKAITFYRDFKGKRGDKVKGAVQYQTCNDMMCFPPAIENFVVIVN